MTLGVALPRVALAALMLAAGPPAGAPAQQAPAPPSSGRDTLDRVAAVVGNTIILGTEVDEELFTRPEARSLPSDPEVLRALRLQVLQELVDLELLYQRALQDTLIKVTDEEVTSAVDEQVRNVRQRFRTDQAYRDDLRQSGFQTPQEYRRWLTDRQRKQLTTSALIDMLKASGKLKPVIPTEKEMKAFFEARKGAQQRPETYAFRQIVIAPKPTEAARERALALADSILRELRQGAEFETAARRFSQDEGSKDQGGTLGWFRRGVMFPAFEAAAFNQRPGVVSDPVETPVGYHLIQVERIQPAEVLARHILLMPEIRQEDADSAQALAGRVRAALLAGAAFDSLQRLYHDPLEERSTRDLPADKLPAPYAAAFKGLADSSLSPVFTLPLEGSDERRAKYAVAVLDARRPAGAFRYEDVRDSIRGQLGEQMALRRFLDSLRQATYVEVRGQ